MSYLVTIPGYKEKFELEEISFDSIKQFIYEEYLFSYSDILSKIPARKYIKGSNFDWNDLTGYDNIINSKYSDSKVVVYNENNIEICNYSMSKLCIELIEWHLDGESADIEIGHLWSNQLNNFIQAAQWNIALLSFNGLLLGNADQWPPVKFINGSYKWLLDEFECKPIIWYGIVGEPIIEEWIVGQYGMMALVTAENGLGNYGGQMNVQGLEINYNHFFEGNCSWYFGACGEKGADFRKVIETCPIDIVSIYHGQNGEHLIADYFYKVQTK